MRRVYIVLILGLLGLGHMAVAQQDNDEVVWVQVEAQPNIAQATERVRAYAATVPDVNGFSVGRGWFGIVLGPYARADAEQVLRVYRSEGVIPRDSFITFSERLGPQFWPRGEDVLGRGTVLEAIPVERGDNDIIQEPFDGPDPTPRVEPDSQTIQIQQPDETRTEAQRSERSLSRDEKKDLQIALQWAGFYQGAIDGAYGRGTRGAMQAWQQANNFEVTGVLTTLQRAALIKQYNAVLEGLGLELVQDSRTGIAMELPLDVVSFDRYQAPFAHFDATDDVKEAKVLLISQSGDQTTLAGLYDILQTLELMPLEGPRERNTRSFSITGRNSDLVAEARASLEDSEIKGYILLWPTGDEERRTRLLAKMDESFARIDGVLEDAAGADLDQAIDLVAGLQIRSPRLSRSGFFVDRDGTVVTSTEAVQSCTRITLDEDTDAQIATLDNNKGVAVLRPSTRLAPLQIGRFRAAPPRLNSDVMAAGYSYEGVLNAPTVTSGTLSDVRGLGGETDVDRLALSALPGDVGGPVLDSAGAVLGMLLPRENGARDLPDDVSFALDGASILSVLEAAGLNGAQTERSTPMNPVDLAATATGMTVLVSCWD